MKVAFFTPHIFWPSHYETELELIQEHIDKGDEVIQLVCNAELPSCDMNPEHNLQVCLRCMGSRESGRTLIEGKFIQRSFLMLNSQDKEEIRKLPKNFSSVKELQKLRIENFDLGYAVASSIISDLRDPDPNLNIYQQRLESYLISSLGIYRSFLNLLQKEILDRVYIFNGRFAHVKPVLRACQAKGVECFIHERGNNKDFYSLYKNTTPHDIKYIEGDIKKRWDAADEKERVRIGKEYFINRANGVVNVGSSFTKEQIKGLLPEGWDSTKNNIVIFNSSEDEFASVGEEWKNPIYNNQLDGLKKIINDVQSEGNIHLYLRIHPNLKNVSNNDKKQLMNLHGENFTLIPAESLISTYDLLKAATKVVSFGSTIGIEAVFWSKPSILIGKTLYYNLGGTYNATSHRELINLLKADLLPKPIEPALMFGYYYNTFGTAFKYYTPESLSFGKFKGKNLLNENNIKYKTIDWLLWKPIVRNFRPQINNLHRSYLISSKYY